MSALEPADDYCPHKLKAEKHAMAHCSSLRQAYMACVKRMGEIDQLSDSLLKEKCEANGVAIVDFAGKAIPREKLIATLKPKANCTGQYFDYFHCVDHHAAKEVFKGLK